MIKVNLLKDQTTSTRRTVIKPQSSRFGLLILTAMAVVVAGIGITRFYLVRQVQELAVDRNRLNTENERLKGLRKQIDEYEKMLAERQSRIGIIEQLKLNQTGPVLLLNRVVHSIPSGAVLWLTALDQKGDQVRITGFTARGETVPDFMSNLSATGFFKSVDLELYEDVQKDAAKFILVCVNTPRMSTE